MDNVMIYRVFNLYKCRQYDKCIDLCNQILEQAPNKQIDLIRMRSMTIQAKIAGNHYDETVFIFSDKNDLTNTTLAKTPRPGTTFQTAGKVADGFARGTQLPPAMSRAKTGTARARSSRTALQTASYASRAATAITNSGQNVPINIAIASIENKDFLTTAKIFFEFVFYCEGDVRKAMEILLQAQKEDKNEDWWWSYSLSKCYISLGMTRQAETELRQTLKLSKHLSLFLRLINIYNALNQPLSALEVLKQALTFYPNDTTLMLEEARIHEAMGNSSLAVKQYRNVAIHDADNTEAIASIAVYNFYNDQPEIALRYYRRLLATTPPSAELYNNIGMCWLGCNQWDLILPCFRHALQLATEPEIKAEICYNLAHVALATGDLNLAKSCLQASLSIKSDHTSSHEALQKLKLVMSKNMNRSIS